MVHTSKLCSFSMILFFYSTELCKEFFTFRFLRKILNQLKELTFDLTTYNNAVEAIEQCKVIRLFCLIIKHICKYLVKT